MRSPTTSIVFVATLLLASHAFPSSEDPVMLAAPISTRGPLACSIRLLEDVALTAYDEIATASYALSPTQAARCASASVAVVRLEGSINAGRQYDRYGALWVDAVELVRTTTPEPNAERAIAWAVEADVSDYLGWLVSANRTARLSIPNVVDDTYTGVLRLNATLDLYDDDDDDSGDEDGSSSAEEEEEDSQGGGGGAPADFVAGLAWTNFSSSPWDALGVVGDASVEARLNGTGFPVARAVVDVYLSGHACDEFFYTNVPDDDQDDDATAGACGGGTYREVQVLIDGVLAGSAVPFGVVYSGGLDPLLWRPLAGVASFAVPPYRFDATPFAARLAEGGVTVEVRVVGANDASGVWYVDPVVLAWRAADDVVAVTELSMNAWNESSLQVDDVNTTTSARSRAFSTTGRSQFGVSATLEFSSSGGTVPVAAGPKKNHVFLRESPPPRADLEKKTPAASSSTVVTVSVETNSTYSNLNEMRGVAFQHVEALATSTTRVTVNTTTQDSTTTTSSEFPLSVVLEGETTTLSLARRRRFDTADASVAWVSAANGTADLVASGASDVGDATTRADVVLDVGACAYDWVAVATNGSVVCEGETDFACDAPLAQLGLRSCGLDVCGLEASPYSYASSGQLLPPVVLLPRRGQHHPESTTAIGGPAVVVRASAVEMRRWVAGPADDRMIVRHPVMPTSTARRVSRPAGRW